MNSRVDLINRLCRRYERCAYLEIGCRHDECFANINAARKVGVDPEWGGTHRMTSDEYFAEATEGFDVVFVDGLHLAVQARKDVANAERHLNPAGVIVLHDCLPDDAWHADPQRALDLIATDPGLHGVGEWCGDVWRVLVELNARPDMDVALWPGDHGCGLVMKRRSPQIEVVVDTFEEYQAGYRDWMLLIDDEEGLEQWLTDT